MDLIANKYQVTRKLGEGGFGAVFLVQHLDLDIPYALKLIGGAHADNPDFAERFKREAVVLGRLLHINSIPLRDFGRTDDGQFYMAMDYCQGQALSEVSRARGPLPAAEVVDVARQCLDVMAQAHQLGIVHRDIKPDNIMLELDASGVPQVKVLDFGIASLAQDPRGASAPAAVTEEGAIIGTPMYMAPEQAHGRPVDARTDLYALGLVMYHLLAGRPPFQGSSAMELLMKQVGEEPPALSSLSLPQPVPPDVQAVVTRAIAKDPALRFQTATEMQGALPANAEVTVKLPGQRPVEGERRRPRARSPRREARRRSTAGPPAGLYAGAGVGVLAVALVLGFGLRGRSAPAPAPPTGPSTRPAPPAPKPAPPAVDPGPQPIRVVQAGGGDFDDLSVALRQAPPGARILLGAGRYRGGLAIARPVEIVGVEADRGRVVIDATDEGVQVALDGEVRFENLTLRGSGTPRPRSGLLHVTRGSARIDRCHLSHGHHLVFTEDSGRAHISRSLLEGGAQGVVAYGPALTIEDTELRDHTFQGVLIGGPKTEASLLRCRISRCRNGVLTASSSRTRLVACHVLQTKHSAVVIDGRSQVRLERCHVYEAKVEGLHVVAQATLVDCRVHSCGTHGLAVQGRRARLQLQGHCRIYDNVQCGVLFADRATGQLTGADVYRNRKAGVAVVGGSAPLLVRCKVYQNRPAGVVIIDADPTIQDSKLVENTGYGVLVQGKVPRGRVSGCDLSNNTKGPWKAPASWTGKGPGNRP